MEKRGVRVNIEAGDTVRIISPHSAYSGQECKVMHIEEKNEVTRYLLETLHPSGQFVYAMWFAEHELQKVEQTV